MSEEKVIQEKLAEFVNEMRPLDSEFAKVLHDNLWDLYIKTSRQQDLEPIEIFFDKDELEDCVVTLLDWHNMELNRDFIPDDGDAYYGTSTHYSHVCAFRNDAPEWATHVILFGK